MNWENIVAEAFEQLAPDIRAIFNEAKGQTLRDWNNHHRNLASLSGFATGVIPVAHLAGIVVDSLHIMRRMGHASYGIGAILGERHDLGDILETEDLPLVLGLLADDPAIENAIAQGMATELAERIGAQVGIRAIARTLSQENNELVVRRLSRRTISRLGSRLATRAARRAVWPIGAALATLDNRALIDDMLDAAMEFYSFKIEVARRFS